MVLLPRTNPNALGSCERWVPGTQKEAAVLKPSPSARRPQVEVEPPDFTASSWTPVAVYPRSGGDRSTTLSPGSTYAETSRTAMGVAWA